MSYLDYLAGLRDGMNIGFQVGVRKGFEIGSSYGFLAGYNKGYEDSEDKLLYEPLKRFLEQRKYLSHTPKKKYFYLED